MSTANIYHGGAPIFRGFGGGGNGLITGNESFVTINDDTATLPNSRQLQAGNFINVIDTGAGFPVQIHNTAPENTTVSNLGFGYGVYAAKVLDDIQLKSLTWGSGIALAATATEIEISCTVVPGESNTASNLGLGYGVYSSKAGVDLQFKSLVPGTGISISATATEITITNSATGEANTASNLGSGEGVFASKVGVDLQFKSLNAGTGISISATATDITVTNTAPGEVNTASNLGLGYEVFSAKVGVDFQFRTLLEGAGIQINQTANDLTIVCTISAFTDLSDTPGNYTGEVGGRTVRVNAGKTALEYVRAGVAVVSTLVDAAPIAVDASKGDLFKITLTNSRTMANPTNPTEGQKIIFRLQQGGTGSYTITWDTKYRFSTELPSPTLSTAVGKIDYLGFIYHATDDKWDYIAQTLGFN